MSMWFGGDYPKGKVGKSKVTKKSCWETHPTYYIDGMPISGGSCTRKYHDVDVFIGFDWGMTTGDRSYPWVDGVDIAFRIADMGVPKSIKDFKKLLKYTAQSMESGKSVYAGCIGGHGRTGLFLAALTTYMTGDKNSIRTVRDNYCNKAVESQQQIEWLHKHFGITKIKASKSLHSVPKDISSTFLSDQDKIQELPVTKCPRSKYHCVVGDGIFNNK